MSDNQNAYTLPVVGDDWLPGLQDFYIIYSIKTSTQDKPRFWVDNGFGYTDYWHCGVFHKEQVTGNIWLYNDGLNAVAIPLTVTALTLLGIKVSIDTGALDAFANRSATK